MGILENSSYNRFKLDDIIYSIKPSIHGCTILSKFLVRFPDQYIIIIDFDYLIFESDTKVTFEDFANFHGIDNYANVSNGRYFCDFDYICIIDKANLSDLIFRLKISGFYERLVETLEHPSKIFQRKA